MAGPLHIYVGAPRYLPPFAVEALVVEQDRDLLLETETRIREPAESIPALLRALEEWAPKPPGTVLVRGTGVPYDFLAIVHDFSAQPSSREAWVSAALDATFRESEARQFKAIGLQLLGSVHGRLAPGRSVELIAESLARSRLRSLEDLWLLVPATAEPQLADPLVEAGHRVSYA